jgi:hypothetical protein
MVSIKHQPAGEYRWRTAYMENKFTVQQEVEQMLGASGALVL